MHVPEYFIVLHCTVSGKNEDLLGTDETEIVRIDLDLIDAELNEVAERKVISISPHVDETESTTADECNVHCKCLKDAIEQINAIISVKDVDELKQIAFATSSCLQFRQCLHPHAVRNEIELPKTFFQYYNVCNEYKIWSGKQDVPCLKEVAEDIALDLKSFDEESGQFHLCTEIVRELVRKGHVFSDPEIISDSLLPGMCTGYVKDEMMVRVRGLPWQVSDHEVASFFRGLNIGRGGVALCLNMKGRRNGEAFVKFVTAEHRDLALQRHKHHLAGRYIEIYKGAAQDFLKIARGPTGAMNVTSSFLSRGAEVIIRMRGLPYTASVTDIMNFYGKDLQIKNGENGVMLVHHPDGTLTGDAFVIFADEQCGKDALKKHRCKIGQRYVELFRSTQAELQQVLTMYNVGYHFVSPIGLVSPLLPPLSPLPGTFPVGLVDRGGQRVQTMMTMSCLRLRGLPFSASKDDIITFLGQHSQGIIGTVHIIFNLQGRPSGESFVQMSSPEMAHKAANELHLKHMGERYIEVFQCSVHDMSLMLTTSHANQMAAQHLNHLNNNNNTTPQNNSNGTFMPNNPLPVHHQLLSPTRSNGLVHPVLPPFPPMYNAQLPPPTLSPNGFYPAPAFSVMNPVVPHDSISLQMSQYCKPNGMAVGVAYPTQPVDDIHRTYSDKSKDSNGNRPVTVFMG